MRTKAPSDAPSALEVRPGLASRTGDPIDAWLTLLTTMLRLPASQAVEIRDELEDHMRTRVRDQLVEGVAEHDAVRRAIDEVGEASAVADRFRSAARTPLRKTLMYASILTASAAALGFSIAAFTQTPSQPVAYEAAPMAQVVGLGSVEITTDPNWTFEQFADAMGDAARKPTFIHWRSLSDYGIERGDKDWRFEVEIQNASFETVMTLLNERIDWHGVVARTHEGRLEFVGQEYLDQQTVKLVRFDIADIIEHVSSNWTNDPDSARGEVIDLIQSYVEPDAWEDNGGMLASTRAVGDQLFIQAPERFFPKIEWLLSQLRDGEDGMPARSALPGDARTNDDTYQIRVAGKFLVQEGSGRRVVTMDTQPAMKRLEGLVGVQVESVREHPIDGTTFEAVVSAPCKSVADARIAALETQALVSIRSLKPLNVTDDDSNPLTTIRIQTPFPQDTIAQLAPREAELALAEVKMALDGHALVIKGPARSVASVARWMDGLHHAPRLVSEDTTRVPNDDSLIYVEGAVDAPGTYRLPADGWTTLPSLLDVDAMTRYTRPADGLKTRWSRVVIHRDVQGEPRQVAAVDFHAAAHQRIRLEGGDTLEFVPPRLYTVQRGDTAQSIAHNTLGDKNAWALIARENLLKGKAFDPAYLQVGKVLIIPDAP